MDDNCFPDRTDMCSIHSRSAVRLSSDLQTLMLVTADGRTSSNTDMYGAELTETMGLLNAHFALNIDGGGSTQLWQDGYQFSYRTLLGCCEPLGCFCWNK